MKFSKYKMQYSFLSRIYQNCSLALFLSSNVSAPPTLCGCVFKKEKGYWLWKKCN